MITRSYVREIPASEAYSPMLKSFKDTSMQHELYLKAPITAPAPSDSILQPHSAAAREVGVTASPAAEYVSSESRKTDHQRSYARRISFGSNDSSNSNSGSPIPKKTLIIYTARNQIGSRRGPSASRMAASLDRRAIITKVRCSILSKFDPSRDSLYFKTELIALLKRYSACTELVQECTVLRHIEHPGRPDTNKCTHFNSHMSYMQGFQFGFFVSEKMSSFDHAWSSGSGALDSTPRPIRRSDQVSSSLEFTPAKDISARTSSFKRLSGSASRGVRADDICSVLSKPRMKQPDFKFESTSSGCRGRSPATPKRTRADLGEDRSIFDDLSPIGSPKMCGFSPDFEPRTTPKRRRPSGGLRSSLNDLFASNAEQGRQTSTLSRSVDFSNMSSLRAMSPPRKSSSRDFTPPRTRSQARVFATPQAPRKPIRSRVSMSLPNFEDLPRPRRLFGDELPAQPESASNSTTGTDYSGVMGIVGFISSLITRSSGQRTFALSSLVELISSHSKSHTSAASATAVLRSLATAVPDWVSVTSNLGHDEFSFAPEMKTFEVLGRLRDLKRQELMARFATD